MARVSTYRKGKKRAYTRRRKAFKRQGKRTLAKVSRPALRTAGHFFKRETRPLKHAFQYLTSPWGPYGFASWEFSDFAQPSALDKYTDLFDMFDEFRVTGVTLHIRMQYNAYQIGEDGFGKMYPGVPDVKFFIDNNDSVVPTTTVQFTCANTKTKTFGQRAQADIYYKPRLLTTGEIQSSVATGIKPAGSWLSTVNPDIPWRGIKGTVRTPYYDSTATHTPAIDILTWQTVYLQFRRPRGQQN